MKMSSRVWGLDWSMGKVCPNTLVIHTMACEEGHWERPMPEISTPLRPDVSPLLLVKQEAPTYSKAPRSKDEDVKLHSVVYKQWDCGQITYPLQTSIFSFLEWGEYYLPCLTHEAVEGFKR